MQILREEAEIIKSSNSLETKAASIEMTPEMFKLLSSGIYTFKVRAVIRELSCNWIDAHAMNGNESRPGIVHLPSQLEPYFEVRDFGPGMTHDQIMNLYLSYGTSTKRDSNTQIGGFGIGSKSPFAIAQSFTVTSFCEGKKRQYSVYMENGIPQVTKLIEIPTIEESGLAVRVAVSTDKIQEFLREAGVVYAHFPVKPICNREFEDLYANRAVISQVEGQYKAFGLDATQQSASQRGLSVGCTVGIVMGNIEYPVKITDIIGQKPLEDFMPGALVNMLSHILIYVPIGSVAITASREALQLNDDTIAACQKILKTLGEEFLVNLQTDFDKCVDMMEVADLYLKIIRATKSQTAHYYIRKNIKWQGRTIEEIIMEFDRCRHRQATDEKTGQLMFRQDGKTPVMELAYPGVEVITGRAFERSKNRPETNTWKEESAFSLFGATSEPRQIIDQTVFIIRDRVNKNGTPKTTGNYQIFAGIMNLFYAAHPNGNSYNCRCFLFDSEAEIDQLCKLHGYTKSKLSIYKTSDHEAFYIPKTIVRGQVKLLVADGDSPTETKVDLSTITEPQYFIKATGYEIEGNTGFDKQEDMNKVARRASNILGKPVYVFRKANWSKIPDEWIEVTADELIKCITPVDWVLYNRHILVRENKKTSTQNMTAVIHCAYNGRVINDGYFYKRDLDKGLNLVSNMELIDELFNRPAYFFAQEFWRYEKEGNIGMLLDILPGKCKFAQKIGQIKLKQSKKVKRAIAARKAKYPLVHMIDWSKTSLKEVAGLLGLKVVELTDEEKKLAY